MAITLNDNISASAAKPLDALRGPYTGADEATAKAAACAAIAGGATGLRFVGRQVDLIINGVAAVYVWLSDIGDADLVPLTTPLPQALAPGDTPTFTGLILDGTNPLVVNKSTLTSDAPIIATQVNIPDFTEIDVLQCGIKNTDGNAVNWIFRGASVASGDAPYDVVLNLPQYTGGYLALKSDISAAQQLAFNDQAGTAYTLVLADANTKIRMSNTAANTVTIPTDASVAFPIGTRIYVSMNGTGATSIVGESGVTVEGVTRVIDVQYNEALLVKEGYDIWKVTGIIPDVSAVDGPLASIKRTASGNNVQMKNSVLQIAGAGNSLKFNGVNQYFTGSDAGLPTGTSVNMSVSCWFKTTSLQHIVLFSYGNGSLSLFIDVSYGLATIYNNATYCQFAYPANGFYDNNWHHAVFVIDGLTQQFYLDGVSYPLHSGSGYLNYNIVTNGTVCNNSFNGGVIYYPDVSIDQLLVYDASLSSDNVTTIYNSGGGTNTPLTTGLIRRYEFEDAAPSTTCIDTNPNGSRYPLTLNNYTASPMWGGTGSGIVPTNNSTSISTALSIADGVFSNEKGTVRVGDNQSGTYIQGYTIKDYVGGSIIPRIVDNNGNTYISASNTLETARSKSSLGVTEVAIGSYATTDIAPANGLIVSGTTGLGTASPSGAYILDINGNSRSQGIFNNYGTIPEVRWVTSADSAYARFQRSTASSNNLFEGKNQVLQIGGIGKAIHISDYTSYFTGSDADMPVSSGSTFSLTMCCVFKQTSFYNTYSFLQYGNLNIYHDNGTLYIYAGLTQLASFVTIPTDQTNWHQIVVSFNGSTIKCFVDNVELIYSGIVPAYTVSLNGTFRNSFLATGQAQSISLDQFLCYNRTLNRTSGSGGADEIAALYNSGSFTATPPDGAIRRYEFEDGTGNIVSDTNSIGTQYPLTLINNWSWIGQGIVPVSASASETTFFTVSDGLTNAEKGIATWGDYNGRNQQQGKWFQWSQNNMYPLVSNNTGQWLFDPANGSNTSPTILSTIEVAGNLTIGNTLTGNTAAPSNGLLVQGDATFNGLVNALSTAPELRVTNSADSTYGNIKRVSDGVSYTASIMQAAGLGACLQFDGSSTYVQVPTTDLPSSANDYTISIVFKTSSTLKQGLIYLQDNVNPAHRFGLQIASTGFNTTNSGSNGGNGSNNFCDGLWHLAIITLSSGGQCDLYVDNNHILTDIILESAPVTSIGNIQIGMADLDGAGNYYLDGEISQVGIWTKVLTSAERLSLWASGYFTSVPPSTANSNLVRLYQFQDGSGIYAADDSTNHATAQLYNSPTWLLQGNGAVPQGSTPSLTTYLYVSDGLSNGERGRLNVGDELGSLFLNGLSVTANINNTQPMKIGFDGNMLLTPGNTNSTARAKNALDIAGAVVIGNSLATNTIAPTNGLAVQGNMLLGTTTDNRTDQLQIDGNLSLTNAGNKLKIATGTNASIGTAQLVAGTITVNTTAITANSIVMLSRNTPEGQIGPVIWASIGDYVPGASFVINSTSTTDTSTVNWWIIN